MKIQIHALMFACALGAATPTIHAQKQDCTPPQADSKMPPDQQEAAADGYRIACESVKAYKKRAAEQKSAAEVDEYIPDHYFPKVPQNATLEDYQHWLYIEEDSCPNLVKQARASLPGFTTDAGKIAFLKTIQSLVTAKRACE